MDHDYTPYLKPEYYVNRELSWLQFNEACAQRSEG